MSRGGVEGGGGGRKISGEGGGGYHRTRGGRYRGGWGLYYQEGDDELVEGGDPGEGGFQGGWMAEEAMWQTVILISKGRIDYRGIGLVEVVWKVVVVILNCRLTASITYHIFLHGLWAGRGSGTTTFKAKLLHQLVAMREEVLHVIFLYLHKTYDNLDKDRCLEILEVYRVSLQSHCILQVYWDRLWVVARVGG